MAINFRGGRWTPNEGRSGIVGIATSPEMRAALLKVVENGKQFAQNIAPVRSGDYRDSFETEVRDRGEGRKKRAEGVLKNTSDHGTNVEFGTQPDVSGAGYHPGTKAQRVLGRTLEQMKNSS